MASGATEVSICNLALSRLGHITITALTDDTKEARECNRIYALTRDMELADHAWGFAIRQTNLAADATAPDWDYDDRYPLPSDCLRVLEVDGTTNWRVEGGNLGEATTVYIVCDLSSPIYIKYVARVTNTALFDLHFVDALAARLAASLAIPLAQNNTLAQLADESYRRLIAKARAKNSIQSGARRPPVSSWISARN